MEWSLIVSLRGFNRDLRLVAKPVLSNMNERLKVRDIAVSDRVCQRHQKDHMVAGVHPRCDSALQTTHRRAKQWESVITNYCVNTFERRCVRFKAFAKMFE